MADAEYRRLTPRPINLRLVDRKRCQVEGCAGDALARGLCGKHWQRWSRHGDPLARSKSPPLYGGCTLKGCDRPARSRWKDGTTMCAFHYLRMLLKGTAQDPKPPAPVNGLCVEEGCRKPIRSKEGQHCETHYYRIRRENLKGDAKYLDQQRRSRQARRAREVAAFVETVSPAEVMRRDKWICHLCEKMIPKALPHPAPLSGTLDHVIPLARGGLHSYANIKAAHLVCNLAKGAKTTEEVRRGASLSKF